MPYARPEVLSHASAHIASPAISVLGQSGGQAIAETLFGDNDPSGRLTQTFYTADFTSQMDMGDMSMRPKDGVPSGRTYRFYTG
jgi:hypothetical protein